MTKIRWALSADRRATDYATVATELEQLASTLEGLEVEIVEQARFEQAPDGGAFRDFVPIAVARADEVAVLEAMLEELIEELGFAVDIQTGS